MDLDDLLGIDRGDLATRHAQALVEADEKLLNDLIAMRKKSERSQADVGELMNISQSAVARIESGERDPRLSTLRRYAMAIDALIEHTVRPAAKKPLQTRGSFWDYEMASSWDLPMVKVAGPRRPKS